MNKINNKFILNIYKQVGKERGQNEINRHSAVWTQSENRENRVNRNAEKRCHLLSKQIKSNLIDILSDTYSKITCQLFFNCSSAVVDR